jgi:transcription factor S
MFCPKCGSILLPKVLKGKKKVLQCSCGYSDEDIKKSVIKEEITNNEEKISLEVGNDEEDKMLPVTEAECPKCGCNECYYWLIQTRASDEPETKFLKCCKCKHVFRDYN